MVERCFCFFFLSAEYVPGASAERTAGKSKRAMTATKTKEMSGEGEGVLALFLANLMPVIRREKKKRMYVYE